MSIQSESEFLASYDDQRFARPSLTVDVVLLTAREGHLEVAVKKRSEHPDKGKWALPGGFVALDESLETAAFRVVSEKIGIRGVYFEQLYTFGDPHRDPRTRIVTVAYVGLVSADSLIAELAAEAKLARIMVPWIGETGGPVSVSDDEGLVSLAFDHESIIAMAVQRLRGKLNYAPIGYQLLPPTFTLRKLQAIHECVLGQTLNKDSFRRRMLASGDLASTGEFESEVGHRPAELYRFARQSAL